MRSRLLNETVFFLDRSLGKKKVAAALRRVGANVVVHDDRFPQDAKDEEWLQEAGRLHWVVLTKDREIKRRKLELDALLTGGVRTFALTRRNLSGDEMAEVFAKALPKMLRLLSSKQGPFIATVSRTGEIKLIFP